MEQNPESCHSENQQLELLTIFSEAKMQQRNRLEDIDRFMDERETCNLDSEIMSCSKELNEHEASIERDRCILEAEKAKSLKRNEELKKAIEQQRIADENLLNLLKEQQREKNESLKQITELKRVVSPLDEVTKKLNDLQEEYDDLEGLCQQLNSKERLSSNNFQEVRKALIEGLINVQSSSRVTIGVKRMGEIDVKAFRKVCSPEEADLMASGMCSTWQEKLKNPEWHPFRTVTDKSGNHRRVIDQDDESLVGLWEEWGDGVYNSVTTALMELQNYNPSGCYPVPELWNFKEDREATVREVMQHLLDQQKKVKRRRS